MTAGEAIFERAAWRDDKSVEPTVSFVIPMYNEQAHIVDCINSILAQGYPADKLQIVVVDGDSTDGSAQIVKDQFSDLQTQVLLISNPLRKTSGSLNLGLKEATGQVIVILGAHAGIEAGFLRYNIENLRRENVACSGGTLLNIGGTPIQVATGVAMSHPFAMAVPHRYRRTPGYMKTAVFGAYLREVFDKIGSFEENWEVPDDADLNHRVTEAGYKIYYDPRIRTRYFPRKTFGSLAAQMLRYGFLRAQMLHRHYGAISWFHLVPPLFVLLLAGLGMASFFTVPARYLLALLLLVYGSAALGFALDARFRQGQGRIVWIWMAFISIQLSWGYGFLKGLLTLKHD